MTNLYQAFVKKQTPLESFKLESGAHSYCFADFDKLSAQLANYLISLGLKKGDRVAVQVEKSVNNLCLYFACLRAGIIFLPLNNTYSNDELNYFFFDATPTLIVCDPSKKGDIEKIKNPDCHFIKTLDVNGRGTLTETLEKHPENFENDDSASQDTAVILYTSGTTGKPKGAMITHGGLLSNAQDLVAWWGITANDIVLHMLPLFHVHGLFFALHTAILARAKVILVPKFDQEMFFRHLPQTTVFMGVPTYYMRLLQDQRLTREATQHIRLLISGSAPLLPATFEAFEERTAHTILERYGMTETGINTSNPLQGKRKVGSVGLPLPQVQVRIADDHNHPLGKNQVGNIQIKGENLFKGYWKQPKKTQEDFTQDGYFKTGDIGMFDEEGHLSIVGRAKDLIITGGLNVYPKEIELTIDVIRGVSESAVIGVPHPDFGEAVVAIVVAKDLDEASVLSEIKKHHASYKCPKKIFFVENLPKNTMGKIQKNILRGRFETVFFHN